MRRRSAILFVAAFFLPLLFSPPSVLAATSTSVRVSNQVQALASETNAFRVPVFFRAAPGTTAVQIGLDYDELLVFNDSWSVRGTRSLEPSVRHSADERHVNLLIPIDQSAPWSAAEQVLIWLDFGVSQPAGNKNSYGYRSFAEIHIDKAETFLIQSLPQTQLHPEILIDGGVTLYFTDAIEVGSVRKTPDRQVFRVPVFVSHITEETKPLLIGLDYDELFLQLLDVEPVHPLLLPKSLTFHEKTKDGGFGWVEVAFRFGLYPRLLREHVLDLVFEYRPEAGLPEGASLEIQPVPGAKFAGGGDDASQSPVQVRGGMLFLVVPEFLRGDGDDTGALNINDAVVVLERLTGYRSLDASGLPERFCPDAMDADASGQIDVSDGVYLLEYLFLGGPPPALPFPEPGITPPGLPYLGCGSDSPVFEKLPLPQQL